MRFHNFTYLLKEGARNVLHNKLMSFACIGVLIACLLLIGSAALFSLNVNSMVQYVEQQNEVIAFLDEETDRRDAEILELTLRNMDNILDVDYVTKEQELEERRAEAEAEFAGVFDGLEEDNPLLDKFVIRIADTSLVEETLEQLRGVDGVFKVNASTDVAHVLTGLKRGVTLTGAVVVVILVIVSVVIITNTIKLTVFSRRKEINIMKYVGATDSFIRLPFLVEGMLIGLVAATLAFLILGFGYTYLLQWAGENYAEQLPVVVRNTIDFWDYATLIFGSFAGLGIFIGIVGSGVFVRKYLKV